MNLRNPPMESNTYGIRPFRLNVRHPPQPALHVTRLVWRCGEEAGSVAGSVRAGMAAGIHLTSRQREGVRREA